MDLTNKSPAEIDALLEHKTEDELRVIYDEALKLLPSHAPLFLPTEKIPIKDKIKGVEHVRRIYRQGLKDIYLIGVDTSNETPKGTGQSIHNATVGGMLEAQIEQLTSIAQTYHEAMQALQVRLQKETIRMDNVLLQNAELQTHAAAQKAEVEDIYRSTSWRITAPLRKIGQLLRYRWNI